jgi:hypothetical protein
MIAFHLIGLLIYTGIKNGHLVNISFKLKPIYMKMILKMLRRRSFVILLLD